MSQLDSIKQSIKPSVPVNEFEQDLALVLHEIRTMLIEKNRKYGDAALNPPHIFSTLPASEIIASRIDEKISRLASRQDDDIEDTEKDLLGYLVLRQIALKREQEDK